MAGRKRSKSRRKPQVRRDDGEVVGLELTLRFRERPRDSFSLVRDIVERVLVFTDDARTRALYRRHFDLAETDALDRIPLDSMFAELLGRSLDSIEAARDRRDFDHASIVRWAGRGALHRRCVHVTWGGAPRQMPELNVWLTLNDLPPGHRHRIGDFAEALVVRAVRAGGCAYGYGIYRQVCLRQWHSGRMGDHEAPVLTTEAMRRLAEVLGARSLDRVTGVHHLNLLSPRHLDRLGGRDEFVRELSARASGSPDFARLAWRKFRDGSLLVLCPRVDFEFFNQGVRTDSHFVIECHEDAAWLLVRFMDAGLLVGQDPDTLAVMERFETAARAAWEAQIAPTTSACDIDEPERGRASSDLMRRMWEAPPRFIAGVARALDNRAKSGVRRMRGGHGERMTGFSIARGEQDVAQSVWGRMTTHGDVLPPYAIGGPTQRSALCVFDPALHGFDAENGLGGRPARRALDRYHCSCCGHDRFRVVFLFEYGDPDDLDDPVMRERPEDFFSWFTMRTTCAGCGRKEDIGNVECA